MGKSKFQKCAGKENQTSMQLRWLDLKVCKDKEIDQDSKLRKKVFPENVINYTTHNSENLLLLCQNQRQKTDKNSF